MYDVYDLTAVVLCMLYVVRFTVYVVCVMIRCVCCVLCDVLYIVDGIRCVLYGV